MNLLAFLLVAFALVVGIISIVQSGGKSLTAWALAALAAGVLVQHIFIDWSHTIHA